jgi:predicted unusual protein kinase regulating ubiquinone biosynthesis (AarF/ABC1/UbiB family)
MDPAIDTSPIAPALASFFDSVLDRSISELNFKAIVDGLGAVLFEYPFQARALAFCCCCCCVRMGVDKPLRFCTDGATLGHRPNARAVSACGVCAAPFDRVDDHARHTGLQVPAYYALILRSLTVLEGVALSADRNYKLLAKAYPYMAKRLLTDPNPKLRTTFEELMLKGGQFRWNRLQDLVLQSQKSQGFESAQLWLVADWFLSDSAQQIRDKVVEVRCLCQEHASRGVGLLRVVAITSTNSCVTLRAS